MWGGKPQQKPWAKRRELMHKLIGGKGARTERRRVDETESYRVGRTKKQTTDRQRCKKQKVEKQRNQETQSQRDRGRVAQRVRQTER